MSLSTGEKIGARRIYRGAERALAVAQRARKKRRVNAIHAHIAHRRNDFHHKLAARIVREFDYIAVGNVNAAGLAKTGMAKSVLDAGWSSFGNMLFRVGRTSKNPGRFSVQPFALTRKANCLALRAIQSGGKRAGLLFALA